MAYIEVDYPEEKEAFYPPAVGGSGWAGRGMRICIKQSGGAIKSPLYQEGCHCVFVKIR